MNATKVFAIFATLLVGISSALAVTGQELGTSLLAPKGYKIGEDLTDYRAATCTAAKDLKFNNPQYRGSTFKVSPTEVDAQGRHVCKLMELKTVTEKKPIFLKNEVRNINGTKVVTPKYKYHYETKRVDGKKTKVIVQDYKLVKERKWVPVVI